MRFRHLLGVATAVIVAGCGGTSPSDAAGSREDVTRARSTLVDVVSLYSEVEAAEGELTDRCMDAKGFHVHPAHPRIILFTPLDDPFGRSPDTATAQSAGYRLIEQEKSGALRNEAFDALPQAEKNQYFTPQYGYGSSVPNGPGTCSRATMDVLYGVGANAPAAPLGALFHAAADAYQHNSKVLKALGAWSECLRVRNHAALSSPVEARRRAASLHHQGDPRAAQKEIELATADAICADQTDVREIQESAWEPAAAQALIAFGPQLAAYRDLLREQLARAHQVLGRA